MVWLLYLFVAFLAFSGIALDGGEGLAVPVALVLVFWVLYVLDFVQRYYKFGQAITADLFFVVFFSLFHFSYIIPFWFGWIRPDYEVLYDMQAVGPAVFFSLLCVSLFMVAYRFPIHERATKESRAHDIDKSKKIVKLSFGVLLLALLMFWLPIATVWKAVFSDYKVLISIGKVSPLGKIFWLNQYVGYFGLSAYYVAKRMSGMNFFDSWRDLVPVFYVAGFFLIGDRGGGISFLFILLFGYSLFPRKIRFSGLLLWGLGLVFVSRVIAVTRTKSIYNPVEMIDYYFSSDAAGGFWSFFHEFGASLKTVVIGMHYVPDSFNYWYGRSYIDSLFMIVPNLFSARESSGVGVFITEVAFGSIGETHGRGGSIAMEAYLNFGLIGSLLFLIFGVYLRALYRKFLASDSLYYSVAYLASVGAFSMWMRNTSSVSFRIVAWSLIGVVILNIISNSIGAYKRNVNRGML